MGKDKLCPRKSTSSLVSLSLSLPCTDGSPWSKPHGVLVKSDSAGVGRSMSSFTLKTRDRIVCMRERGCRCVVLDRLCCGMTYLCVLCKNMCAGVYRYANFKSENMAAAVSRFAQNCNCAILVVVAWESKLLFCFICAREHLSVLFLLHFRI